MRMTDISDYKALLQAPFAEDDYEWRAQMASKKGDKVQVLCYVTARAVMNRLDDIFTPFGWQAHYHKGPDGGVVCALSVKSTDGGWITKEDVAENTKMAAIKGGFSSALKRAGNVWGIGRLLYKLDQYWVDLREARTDRKSHYFKYPEKHIKADQIAYWDAPRLPEWAVAGVQAPESDAEKIGDGLIGQLNKEPDKPVVKLTDLNGVGAVKKLKAFGSPEKAVEAVSAKFVMTPTAEKFIYDQFKQDMPNG